VPHVSRFLRDVGTTGPSLYESLHTCHAERRRIVDTFGELEIVNAMGLRVFRKEISAVQAQSSLREFERDLRDRVFQLTGLADSFLERARQLSRQSTSKLGTRTVDLLHVAAALELGADCLYTFDQHQRKLAQTLRLKLN